MEETRRNNHGLGLAPSARREKFVTLLCSSLCICRLAQACIRAKFPQSHQECWLIFSRWPTRPLGPHIQAVGFLRLLLTALSCRLTCSPPSLDGLLLCSALGPSFLRLFPVSWEISRTSPLCEFRAKTKYTLVLYILYSMDACLRPLVSCRLYTTIIRQKFIIRTMIWYYGVSKVFIYKN